MDITVNALDFAKLVQENDANKDELAYLKERVANDSVLIDGLYKRIRTLGEEVEKKNYELNTKQQNTDELMARIDQLQSQLINSREVERVCRDDLLWHQERLKTVLDLADQAEQLND